MSLRMGRRIEEMEHYTSLLRDHHDPNSVPAVLAETAQTIAALNARGAGTLPDLVQRAKDAYSPVVAYADQKFFLPTAPLAQMVKVFKALVVLNPREAVHMTAAKLLTGFVDVTNVLPLSGNVINLFRAAVPAYAMALVNRPVADDIKIGDTMQHDALISWWQDRVAEQDTVDWDLRPLFPVVQRALALTPSSAAAERLFSRLEAAGPNETATSREVKVMAAYNSGDLLVAGCRAAPV